MKNKVLKGLKSLLEFLAAPLKEKYSLKAVLGLTMIFTLTSVLLFEVLSFHERGFLPVMWMSLITVGGLLLGFYGLALLVSLVKELPISTWFFIGPILAGLYIMISSNRSPKGSYIFMLFLAYFIFFISYLLYALFYMIKHKQFIKVSKIYKTLIHFGAIVSFCGLYFLFFTGGLRGDLSMNAFDTFKTDLEIKEALPTYEIIEGVYGNESYVEKYGDESSDLSFSSNIGSFINAFEESKASYLGFNIRNIPLNAHYYMPEGQGPFPVALIVHGNHEMVDVSEMGYGYLGRYLAGRGYVVISVDQNFLNYSTYDSTIKKDKVSGENDARAYLLLEHLKYLKSAEASPDNVFYKKIDLEAIALMGHSRGGEAVAIAEFFNHTEYLPSNYYKRLSPEYNIKSIVAIAPTDGQYKPGERYNEISDVNYLLLHGTHDMDVTYLAGANQYERVDLNAPGYFKSQVLIYGASHGQFNSGWQTADNNPLASKLHNTGQLISRDDQEAIACQLIFYFLESTLKNNISYKKGFENLKSFKDLPDTLYLSQYHESEGLTLVDYTEDNYLQTPTLKGGLIYGHGFSRWYEGLSELDGRKSQIYGVTLSTKANEKASYTLSYKDNPLNFKKLSHLYITLSDATKNSSSLYDFDIELADSQGNLAEISLSSFGQIQHRLDIVLSKLEYFDKASREESMFQTYQLPFDDFDQTNFDWEHVSKITLKFLDEEKRTLFIKDIGVR